MKSWPLFVLLAVLLGAGSWVVLSSAPTPIEDHSSNNVTADADLNSGTGHSESNSLDSEDNLSSALDRRELENRPADASLAGADIPVLPFEGPAASVKMKLVDGQGKAIVDATAKFNLRGWGNDFGGIDMEEWNKAEALPVDRQGQLIANVPIGKTFSIQIGGAFWRVQNRVVQPLQENEVVDLGEIALTPANRVAGTVRNKEGEVLANAMVAINETNGSVWQSGFNARTQTDEEGRFSFDGIRSGRFKFHVSAQGYASTVLQAEQIQQRQGEFPLEIVLERGAKTKGRVLNEDGAAIEGAEIYTVQVDPQMNWWGDWNPPLPQDIEPAAISDANGYFVVYGLSDQEETKLGARAEGFGTAYADEVKAEGTSIIKLPRHFVLGGKVVAAGKGVPQASISLQRFRENGEMDWAGNAQSDEEGKFHFEPVAPGSYTLSLTSYLGSLEAQTLEITADRDDLELKLSLENLLTIQVNDSDGNPVAGATVSLSGANANQRNHMDSLGYAGDIVFEGINAYGGTISSRKTSLKSTKTDINGVAQFASVPASRYQLGVSASGFAKLSDPLDVTGMTQDHEVELDNGGNLRVHVVDDNGQPVIGIQVALRTPDSDQDMKALATDDAGRAIWSNLKAGDYQLSYKASEADGWWWDRDEDPKVPIDRSSVKVKAGQTTDFEMQVRDLALVTVHVTRRGVNAEDVNVSLTEVIAENQNYWGYNNGSPTDGRGEVKMQPVQAGEYEIVVKAGKAAPETRVRENLHVGAQTVEVQLDGGAVKGKLQGSDGAISNATVALVRVVEEQENKKSRSGGVVSISYGQSQLSIFDEQSTNTRTGRYGTYNFTDVSDGEWQIVARAKGYGTWRSDSFSVQGGNQVDLGEHQLYPGGVIHGHDPNFVSSDPKDKKIWGRDNIQLRTKEKETFAVAHLDENGDFRFEDLPSGTYFVQRNRFQSEVVEVSEGGLYRIDLPLEEKKDNQ